MRDLGATIPFDAYETDVLRTLGVVPTQLHPKGWAAMHAFMVVCHCLRIKPTTTLFLNHYTTHINMKNSSGNRILTSLNCA
ncbi:hypothetical protein CR513_58331, partial [Mucuna pruriens]